MLQTRAANSVAKLITNCLNPELGLPARPALKLVENLPKFICSDETFTPQFESLASVDGILTLNQASQSKVDLDNSERNLEQEAQALTRRGALAALAAVIARLGDSVFEQAPNFWNAIAAPILAQTQPGKRSSRASSTREYQLTPYHCTDKPGADDKQSLIDALTTLQVVLPLLPSSLHSHIEDLIPGIVQAIKNAYAVVRNAAGKALAVVCLHMPQQGMRAVLDKVLPLLGDTRNIAHRQGAMEAIWGGYCDKKIA